MVRAAVITAVATIASSVITVIATSNPPATPAVIIVHVSGSDGTCAENRSRAKAADVEEKH